MMEIHKSPNVINNYYKHDKQDYQNYQMFYPLAQTNTI